MIELKIHDVIHNEIDEKPSNIEDYIEEYILTTGMCKSVKNVRVAWGNTNSPIFVYLDENSTSLENYKVIARYAVRGFSAKVRGVNVDRSINDRNIRIGMK